MNTLAVPSDILTIAQERAAQLRMSVSDYISRLIIKDKATGPEHIPPEVAKRWKKELETFKSEDRKNPKPRFTTAQETIDYMNRLS